MSAFTSVEIGGRIALQRKALGWSQSVLGQALARPRTHAAISDIERGRTRLNPEEITELAEILGVSVAYLAGFDKALPTLSLAEVEILTARVEALEEFVAQFEGNST